MMSWKNRVWIVLLAGLLLGGSLWPALPAFSQSRYTMTALLRSTRDEGIMQAFHLMKGGRGEASLQRIVSKPMRVIFKDMRTLHKSLKNYDALSWISSHGEQVIFINDKHRNAPPEALAAMIAHEALHDDEFNSLTEEVASWRHEAEVWIELKARNPQLAQSDHPLVVRLNTIESHYKNNTLDGFVRGLAGYQGLPETSPGFDAQVADGPQAPQHGHAHPSSASAVTAPPHSNHPAPTQAAAR